MNRSLDQVPARPSRVRAAAALAAAFAIAAPALAHFPFVVADPGETRARLVMSETLEPDPEVDVALLASAELSLRGADGRDVRLALGKPDDNSMELALPGAGTRVVHGRVDLGVMKRGKPHVLVYHPKAIVGDAFAPSTVLGTRLDARVIELVPIRVDGGFRLRLDIGGSPASDAELRIVAPDGTEVDHRTGADGATAAIAGHGRYAAWARHWIDEGGTRDGEPYEQVRHYATLVFDVPAPAAVAAVAVAVEGTSAHARAPLPQPVASFGAIECDGWLYVYGGHTGERHDYSTATISGRFARRAVRGSGDWQELPAGTKLQGLNLAAHRGRIVRAGGMEPRNAPGEPSDCRSTDEVALFEAGVTASEPGSWKPLPPLPRPRSSHDLVVAGDELLAIGGWTMRGGRGRDAEWIDAVDVLDLAAEQPRWSSFPQPFARRALIAAVLAESVYVLGGFDAEDVAHDGVDVLDTRTRTWSSGPPIPGGGEHGFGPAACAFGGELYLGVGSGDVYRLDRGSSRWVPVARTTPRIVHRFVATEDEILILGGAAKRRMLDTVEALPRSVLDVAGR